MTKFKIRYIAQGEIEIEAQDYDSAKANFRDKVGVSEDALYENLNPNFAVVKIDKVTE